MPATTLIPAAQVQPAARQTPAPLQPAEVGAWRGTTTPQAAPVLDFDARMEAVNAAMDARLQMASLANDVNTAHIDTEPLDLADVIRGPIDMPRAPIDLYPTPVAALLQRALRRVTDDGWCSGTPLDEQGAICMQAAIYKEAGGNYGQAAEGLDVVMDAIRSQFCPVESVPAFNDAWGNAQIPLRLLQQGADLADARGI